MKWILIMAFLTSSLATMAQYDTISASEVLHSITLQRYHEKPMSDSLVLFNDFDFGTMIGTVLSKASDHDAALKPLNYLRPKGYGFLVLTATSRSLAQPYQMEYSLTFFSDRDPTFRHVKVIKVSVDYNR